MSEWAEQWEVADKAWRNHLGLHDRDRCRYRALDDSKLHPFEAHERCEPVLSAEGIGRLLAMPVEPREGR